jgi:hypothetical protein
MAADGWRSGHDLGWSDTYARDEAPAGGGPEGGTLAGPARLHLPLPPRGRRW